jgi:hypothetical protein
MPRHRNAGLRKRCTCHRRNWAKCPHPWHFNFKWKGTHYRLSLDREAKHQISSKTEAQVEADRIRNAIRNGTFCAQAQPAMPNSSLSFRQFADIYVEEHVKKFCKSSAERNVPSQRRRIELVLVPSVKLMDLQSRSATSRSPASRPTI